MKKTFITFFFILGIIFIASGQAIQNYCQRFNGFQILMRNDTSSLELGNSFTMEAWVFLEEYSPYAVVMGKTFNPRSDDPYMNYSLSFDANGKKAEFIQTTGDAGSYRAATSPDTIPLNTWTHIAGTLGAGQMKLYINGTLVATEISSGNTALTTGVPFAIGTGSTNDFQTTCCGVIGAIKQVRVWNQEQSQTDIQNNMNSSLTGTESGLLACWPLNDSTGQTIVDITPNALNLIRGLSTNVDGEDPYPVWNEILVNPFFELSDIALPDLVKSFPSDVIVIDFNNDGNKDFIVTQVPNVQTLPASFAQMQCVKNNGAMIFSLDTIFLGIDSLSAPRDFAVDDFNGDNKTDLFIADHGTDISPFPGGQNRLFLQNGSGNLVESSIGNIPMVLDFTHNIAVADIDGDNDIDVYLCNLGNQNNTGPRLLINNGNGQFTVNTSNLPSNIINLSPQYMSSRFADIDLDNDFDLILGAADYSAVSKDLVLLNNGSGVFSISNALPQRYGGSTWGTVSIAVIDANNDTWPDLIMSTLYQYQTCQLQLLINNKNGTFSDSTQNIPQNWPTTLSNIWIKMVKTADFNNDGWMDFLICSIACSRGNTPEIAKKQTCMIVLILIPMPLSAATL